MTLSWRGPPAGHRLLPIAWITLAVRIILPILGLVVLAHRLGAQAFRPALAVIAPGPLLAALVLGGIAVTAQAARWRVVLRGVGLSVGRLEAIAECYRSSALNAVLPGGVTGDVARAWRRRTGDRHGWRPSAVSVLAERACGLCALLTIAAVVLAVEAKPASAVAAAVVAGIAWAATRSPLRGLTGRQRASVWGWSVLALAALVALTAITADAIGIHLNPGALATLGLLLLVGMAVPVNLGGWGPREAAGAVAAALVGVPPAVGVAVSAGYGLLATASVLPGFLVLVIEGRTTPPRRGRQVELRAHVLAQDEAA